MQGQQVLSTGGVVSSSSRATRIAVLVIVMLVIGAVAVWPEWGSIDNIGQKGRRAVSSRRGRSDTISLNESRTSFEALKYLLTQCGGDHPEPLAFWDYYFDCPAEPFLPVDHDFMLTQGKSQSNTRPKVQIGDIGFPGQTLDFLAAQMFFLHPTPLRNGRYLEIGGYFGLEFTNSLFFEQYLGWNGWLFEPTTCYERCVKNRPLASVFNIGLCSEATTMEFGGFGTCKPQNASCVPLTSIPRDWERGFDFVSIDVEGLELEVLKAIDFEKVPIKVLLLEWRAKNGLERETYLNQFGYVRLGLMQMKTWATGDEFFYRPDLISPHVFDKKTLVQSSPFTL